MVNVAALIENLKSHYDESNFSWTSPDGGGTTKFDAVFTVENFVHSQGYPFLVITDEGGSSEQNLNTKAGFNMEVNLHICTNWSVISTQTTDIGKRQEAALRVREALDVVREDIVKDSVLSALGIYDQSWFPEFSIQKANIEELNLERRILIMNFKELVNRKA